MAKTKKLPNGRLKISELPSNQPAWAPLYPPMPFKMFGGKAIVVNYETDLDAVLEILPPELTPLTDPPIVSCYLNGGYEFATGGGAYSEMSPLLTVSYQGEPHIYPFCCLPRRGYRGMVRFGPRSDGRQQEDCACEA